MAKKAKTKTKATNDDEDDDENEWEDDAEAEPVPEPVAAKAVAPADRPEEDWHPSHEYPREGAVVEAEVSGDIVPCTHANGIWRVHKKPPDPAAPVGGVSVNRWRYPA